MCLCDSAGTHQFFHQILEPFTRIQPQKVYPKHLSHKQTEKKLIRFHF